MKCNFSYLHYEEILISALDCGYKISSFHDPLQIDKQKDRILYIRHDIDVSPVKAFKMAEIETNLGIKATYFVLVNSPLYNIFDEHTLYFLRKIISLGHWIGLHIDLDLIENSNIKSIEKLAEILISVFGQFIHLTRVLSFHRPNPEVLNKKFNSFVNTYEYRFFSQIKYISDSRRMWKDHCPCKLLKEGRFNQLQLLIHPIWWGDEHDLRLILDKVIKEKNDDIKSYLSKNISPFKNILE